LSVDRDDRALFLPRRRISFVNNVNSPVRARRSERLRVARIV